jgi:predicted DCC family thiol-disulfide oxidoreductase YuxK
MPRPGGPPGAVVLFDGVCNLCSGTVRFVIARDPQARFRFAPLGSVAAVRLLHEAGVSREDSLSPGADSIVLIEGGRVYVRSAAALRIARSLRFPWPMAYALILVPRALRDYAYDVVARRRLQWFGERDTCLVPADLKGLKDRWVDDESVR